MRKKRSTFIYLLLHDLMFQTLLLLLMGGMFGILYRCTDSSESVIFVDVLLVMVLMSMTSPFLQIGFRYEEFQMFHFTRKRFYRYQVLLCILRAAEVALVRTGYQLMLREKFIEYYMEERDTTIAMYHRVPFWELFVSSLCIVFIFNMIYLIGNTWNFNRYSLAIKVVKFVCVVTACVLMIDYYAEQMLRPRTFRLGIFAGLLAVCIGLYFVGKKRYKPEYI